MDVFADHFPFGERDDDDLDKFDPLARGRDSGQQPVHLHGVGEPEDELVDDPIVADRPGQGDDLDVVGHLRDEVVAVEVLQLGASATAGEDRDVVHVRVLDHGVARLSGVLVRKLGREVGLPQIDHPALLFRQLVPVEFVHLWAWVRGVGADRKKAVKRGTSKSRSFRGDCKVRITWQGHRGIIRRGARSQAAHFFRFFVFANPPPDWPRR
jgi:hypothetical protein